MLLCRSVLGQFFLAQEISEEKGATHFGEHAKAAGYPPKVSGKSLSFTSFYRINFRLP